MQTTGGVGGPAVSSSRVVFPLPDGAADTLLDLFAKANAVIDRAAESPKVKLDSPLWLAVAELRAALTAAQGT